MPQHINLTNIVMMYRGAGEGEGGRVREREGGRGRKSEREGGRERVRE